jgi:hypothetical protein
MVKDGEAEKTAEASKQPCWGHPEVKEIEQIKAAIIEFFFESPQCDTFSDPCRAKEQCDAPGFQPKVQAVNELTLSRGIKHFGGPHILGKRDLRESEVGFEMYPLFIHDCPPKS